MLREKKRFAHCSLKPQIEFFYAKKTFCLLEKENQKLGSGSTSGKEITLRWKQLMRGNEIDFLTTHLKTTI